MLCRKLLRMLELCPTMTTKSWRWASIYHEPSTEQTIAMAEMVACEGVSLAKKVKGEFVLNEAKTREILSFLESRHSTDGN